MIPVLSSVFRSKVEHYATGRFSHENQILFPAKEPKTKLLRIDRMGWLSSAACFAMQMRAFSILEKPYIFVLAVVVVLSQEAALDAGNGALVLHIEKQVISAAHAVVDGAGRTSYQLRSRSKPTFTSRWQFGAACVACTSLYNSRNRPSSIPAFEDGDTSVKCVCVCFCSGFLQESTLGPISQLLLQCFI